MRELNNELPIIDLRSPCMADVIARCRKGEKDPFSIYLPRYKKGHICAILAFIEIESDRFPISLTDTLINLDLLKQEIYKVDSGFVIASTPEDIRKAKETGKIALVFGLEGGAPLRGNVSILRTFHELGLRWIELTWNVRNEIGDGVNEQGASGLSNSGRKIVQEMNRLGMIIDVAHISPNSFESVIEITEAPIIASHSSCRAICNHPRNLTDQQIERIAKNGGLVGLCFYPAFLSESGHATINDVLRHMNHIRDLVGVEYIGLGPDFIDCVVSDVAFPKDLEDTTKITNLIKPMLDEGYSVEDIQKIFSENFLRVFDKVCS